MLITNTVFLCGYYSASKGLQNLSSEWQKVETTKKERTVLNNYYFPEFTQCMEDEISMYRKPVNQPCLLNFGDEQVTFHISDLRLWEAPFHIIIYAVHISFETQEFNSVMQALNALRNCAYYNANEQAFIHTALAPIIDVYNATMETKKKLDGDLSWLVESGNKFKLFQIIQVPDGIEKGDENLLLYDSGTLTHHTPLSTGINSPLYIDHILSEHTISVFTNWSGLALLDTFTLLSANTPEKVVENWRNDYFERIYIYQLFRKVFLYSLNLHYCHRVEDVVVLEKRLDEFEQHYSYSAISYNFLPNIISSAIEKSLNTQRDYDQLNKMIGHEIEVRRNQAEQKTNHFLTFLTCLTIFSAIYDFASLLNESFGYENLFPSGYFGFRIVGTTLLMVVLVVYLLLTKKS